VRIADVGLGGHTPGTSGEWRVAGGGWRVAGGGWRVAGGGAAGGGAAWSLWGFAVLVRRVVECVVCRVVFYAGPCVGSACWLAGLWLLLVPTCPGV
jgi:hypothetical protein